MQHTHTHSAKHTNTHSLQVFKDSDYAVSEDARTPSLREVRRASPRPLVAHHPRDLFRRLHAARSGPARWHGRVRRHAAFASALRFSFCPGTRPGSSGAWGCVGPLLATCAYSSMARPPLRPRTAPPTERQRQGLGVCQKGQGNRLRLGPRCEARDAFCPCPRTRRLPRPRPACVLLPAKHHRRSAGSTQREPKTQQQLRRFCARHLRRKQPWALQRLETHSPFDTMRERWHALLHQLPREDPCN
jgi:hypothetical protein